MVTHVYYRTIEKKIETLKEEKIPIIPPSKDSQC